MKKTMVCFFLFSVLGMGFSLADTSVLWTSETPGPSPTPLFTLGPNVSLTPSTRPRHRHHRKKSQVVPTSTPTGLAPYFPTPSAVPNAAPSFTPTPDAH